MTATFYTMRDLFVGYTVIAAIAVAVQSQATAIPLDVISQTGTLTSVTQSKPRPVLLLNGDSITEQGTHPISCGWVAELQARYTRSADVITRGLSGYNTRWFLNYVMPVLEREIATKAYTSPSLITIWLGTNDAVLVNGSNSEKHVPVDNYKNNLIQIVTGFKMVAPAAKILLITPPHIDDAARTKYAAERTDSKRGLVDRSNAMTGNYSRACVEVAGTLMIPVLDLYTYFNAMPLAARNALLADGIHFNAEGNKVVDQQLQRKLNSAFPELISSLNTWQFPAASKYVSEDPWKP